MVKPCLYISVTKNYSEKLLEIVGFLLLDIGAKLDFHYEMGMRFRTREHMPLVLKIYLKYNLK
jgi:hypothetical protein